MKFTTAVAAALSVGSAFAATETVTVHVVKVSNNEGSLTYSPNSVVAAVGDMVQFKFYPANHTVTQSDFDHPCVPLVDSTGTAGVFSGFMPVSASDTDFPLFTVPINDTKPIWIYCSQGKHCEAGMAMVINEDTTANATRSLANYQAAAANAPVNLAPGEPVSSAAGSSPSSYTAPSYGSATASAAWASSTWASSTVAGASGSTTATGSSISATSSQGAAAAGYVPSAGMGIVALAMMLFV